MSTRKKYKKLGKKNMGKNKQQSLRSFSHFFLFSWNWIIGEMQIANIKKRKKCDSLTRVAQWEIGRKTNEGGCDNDYTEGGSS